MCKYVDMQLKKNIAKNIAKNIKFKRRLQLLFVFVNHKSLIDVSNIVVKEAQWCKLSGWVFKKSIKIG